MPQNTVTIVGNLTDDPELRFTPAGQAVARFNVAYSERYVDKSTGEWRDGDPSYFTVIAWRDLAEHVAETFIRGNRVIITGKMQQRSWENKDGDKRYSVEIIADDIGASVRFATARITKATRNRPGPADANGDPWGSASAERPAEPPAPEPAPDGSQEPAEPPAASATNGEPPARMRAARGRKQATEPAQ